MFESAEQLYRHLQSDFNLKLDHPLHGIQLDEFSAMLVRIGVIPHA